MNLTKVELTVPLAKSEGSSLNKQAVFQSLNISANGSINVGLTEENTDITGTVYLLKGGSQTTITYGQSFGFAGAGSQSTEQEEEPSHLLALKAAIKTALDKFLKVELKDK